MKTVVCGIDSGPLAGDFVVNLLVADEAMSFRMRLDLPSAKTATVEDGHFYDIFYCSRAPHKIAQLVLDIFRGNHVSFPVNLGDI